MNAAVQRAGQTLLAFCLGGCLVETELAVPIAEDTQSVLVFLSPEEQLFAADVRELSRLPLTTSADGTVIMLQYPESLEELGLEKGAVPQGNSRCGGGRSVPGAANMQIAQLDAFEWAPLDQPTPALASFQITPFARSRCAERGWFKRAAVGPRCFFEAFEGIQVVPPEISSLVPALPGLCEDDSACSKVIGVERGCGALEFSPPGAGCAAVGTECPDPAWPDRGAALVVGPGGPSLQEALAMDTQGRILIEQGTHALGTTVTRDLEIWGACASMTEIVGGLVVQGGARVTLRNLTIKGTVDVRGAENMLILEDVIVDGQGQGDIGVAITGSATISRSLVQGWNQGVIVDGGGQVFVQDSELRDNRFHAANCVENTSGPEPNRWVFERVRVQRNSVLGQTRNATSTVGALELFGSPQRGCDSRLKDVVLNENFGTGVRAGFGSLVAEDLIAHDGQDYVVAGLEQTKLSLSRALLTRNRRVGVVIGVRNQGELEDITVMDHNPGEIRLAQAIAAVADASLQVRRLLVDRTYGSGVLIYDKATGTLEQVLIRNQRQEKEAAIKAEARASTLVLKDALIHDVEIGVEAKNAAELRLENVRIERPLLSGIQVFIERYDNPLTEVSIRQTEVHDGGVGVMLSHGELDVRDLRVIGCNVGVRVLERFFNGTPEDTSTVYLNLSRFQITDNEVGVSMNQLGELGRLMLSEGSIANNRVAYEIEEGCEPLPEAIIEDRVFFKSNDSLLELPQ